MEGSFQTADLNKTDSISRVCREFPLQNQKIALGIIRLFMCEVRWYRVIYALCMEAYKGLFYSLKNRDTKYIRQKSL